jgi:RND superfamily putative drug exporter
VLVDAFLVRMTLVPAVLAMMGDRAWHLPGWLDRHVPDLDVEGEQLMEQLDHEQDVQPPPDAAAEPAPAG